MSNVDSLFNEIKNKFNFSDSEISVLTNIYSDITKPLPTTESGRSTRLSMLDSNRVQLLNLIYITDDRKSKIEQSYRVLYDANFVKFTKMGRPNQQAVDSEIHSTIAQANDYKNMLNDYESLLGLMYGYLKSIDSVKSTLFNMN